MEIKKKDVSETSKIKRERNLNFTIDETNFLVSLVLPRKDIIECKTSDAMIWENKAKAWKEIEKLFNRKCFQSCFRNHQHLKQKYESLKRDIRKKHVAIQAKRYEAANRAKKVPIFTPAEQKLQDMIDLDVEKYKNDDDSDVFLPCSSPSESITSPLPATEENVPQVTKHILKDDSGNEILFIDMMDPDSETNRKDCGELTEEGSPKCGSETTTTSQDNNLPQLKEWNLTTPNIKSYPVLSKPKEKEAFDILTEEKIELARIKSKILIEELKQKELQTKNLQKDLENKEMQKKILTEELLHKELQTKLLEKELEHKDLIQDLEEQHLLLKIDNLKKVMGNGL